MIDQPEFKERLRRATEEFDRREGLTGSTTKQSLGEGIHPNAIVLVDTTAYGLPGENWCAIDYISEGSASVYPIKVKVPGRGIGQYKLEEVKDVR